MADSKNGIQKVKDLSNQSTELLYGIDTTMSDNNKLVLNNIRKAIATTRKSISDYTGDNITDFHNSVEYDTQDKAQKAKNAKKEYNKKSSSNVVNSNNLGMVQDILANENGRLTLYDNYEVLISYIPVLGKAIEAYVDAIVSPDSYTNTSINFVYSGSEGEGNNYKTIVGNLNAIKENYQLDPKIVDIIRSALTYGDEFYAVLSLDKEYEQILQEKNDAYVLGDNSGFIALTEDETSAFEELHSDYSKDIGKKKKSIEWNKEVNELIDENIEFTTDITSVIEDNIELNESFNMETIRSYNGESRSKNDKIQMLMGNEPKGQGGSKQPSDKFKINGSILKRLDRKRIVKIFHDDITYGYYYIEDASKDSERLTSSETLSGIFSHNFRSAKNMDVNSENLRLKKKIIIDTFVKRIAKKVNKDFLVKNQEFKNTIYNLLKLDYITKKKVKIVFLDANEVQHFYPKLQPDGYGESILKNSLFLGMIYVSTLITTLMMKLIRSPQKRVFYVETGLDEDYEGVVNDFVKNLKTADMKIVGKDINTVLNSIGAFHDVFIPKIDGQAPIEYETMDGLDANLTDDFLEYLQNAVVDSTGVPASFIQSSAEVDFSKELSMQNSQFVRRVTTLQKVFTTPISSLIRILYKNEYQFKDKHLDLVEIDEIHAELPKPMSLMLNTFNEQIDSVKGLMEFVSNVFMAEDDDDKELRLSYTLKLVKEYFPSIEWDRMQELFNEAKLESSGSKIASKLSTASNKSTGNNDENDDGSGGF